MESRACGVCTCDGRLFPDGDRHVDCDVWECTSAAGYGTESVCVVHDRGDGTEWSADGGEETGWRHYGD